jgi:hypothetical protein
MTQEEMRNEFNALYNMMANSQNPAFMHVFGMVHKEMMEWFIANKPELAQEWIEKLESIRWHQYLTVKEAEKIVDGMSPKAPWKRDVWKQTMTQLELPMEEEPYYNSCSLWCEMNKQYSDHAETIARDILKKPLNEIPVEQIVPGIRAMALDVLKDKDHVYNIRKYFSL